MAPLLLALLIQGLICPWIYGEDYCSLTLDPKCVPCSKLCHVSQKCNATYFCPKQCGETIPAHECPDVCNKECLHGRCEYLDAFMDLKCIGCQPPYTGKVCEELCPSRCNKCYQDNSTCISCIPNYLLPNCSETHGSTLTKVTLDASTIATKDQNCFSECVSCEATSGDCIECPLGIYGNKCQNTCSHCNVTLCDVDTECIKCIGNYNSSDSECTPELTDEISTMKSVPKNTMVLFIGLPAACILIVGGVCIWLRLNKRYQLKCENRGRLPRRNSDRGSIESAASDYGYECIRDNDLETYYSHLKENRIRPRPCSVSHYEMIRRTVDDESVSPSSIGSDTMVGNRFEVGDYRVEQIEMNELENEKQSSPDEYEMHTMRYLTLTAT